MLDNLYADIGGKIKNWAKWILIIESIGAIITGIAFIANENFLAGLLTMFCGPVVAWVFSWILYGFGEIICKLCEIERNTRSQPVKTANIGTKTHSTYSSASANIPSYTETINVVETSVSQTNSKKKQWDDIETCDGVHIGKCENCGSKKEKLVHVECTELFGTTRKNVCFECFCKKDCKPISRQ